MVTPDKIFDQLLILQYKTGDNRSLSLLVKRWYPKLHQHILSLTKNEEASNDIAQEVWTAIVKNLKKLRDPSLFSSWAYTIANRKSYDWIRSIQKQRHMFDSENDTEANTVDAIGYQNEPISTIRATIKTFSADDQLILNLFYLENYSLNEISKLTLLPVGTVKSKLFYSREKLKKLLKNGVKDVK